MTALKNTISRQIIQNLQMLRQSERMISTRENTTNSIENFLTKNGTLQKSLFNGRPISKISTGVKTNEVTPEQMSVASSNANFSQLEPINLKKGNTHMLEKIA